jgi:hypothetical protein
LRGPVDRPRRFGNPPDSPHWSHFLRRAGVRPPIKPAFAGICFRPGSACCEPHSAPVRPLTGS